MRCGVDIGGTFTELVTLDEEVRLVENAKATTTPDRWENGEDTIALTQPGRVLADGATVMANALTEGRGRGPP